MRQRFLYWLGTACLVAAGLVFLGLFWAVVVSHLATFFGFGNGDGNGSHYLFWSGSGSDLAYLSFLAAGITVYRKHNCAKRYCWRIGKHAFTDPSDNVTRQLCWKHHPDVKHKTLGPDVIGEIDKRRKKFYLGKQPGRG